MEFTFLPHSFQSIDVDDNVRIRTIFKDDHDDGLLIHPLASLYEITLGSHQSHYSSGYGTLLILPLVGELNLNINDETTIDIEPDQLISINHFQKNIEVKNPDPEEPALYLDLRFNYNVFIPFLFIKDLNIDLANDTLNEIIINKDLTLAIGKFMGRKDQEYPLHSATKLAIYIISGVFEVEHRLMEAGDLMLIQTIDQDKLEFESLAKESIILILLMNVVIPILPII